MRLSRQIQQLTIYTYSGDSDPTARLQGLGLDSSDLSTLPSLTLPTQVGVQRYTASRYDMYLDTDAVIRYAIRYFMTFNIHTITRHMTVHAESITVKKSLIRHILQGNFD